VTVDDPEQGYRQAECRLRAALLGDGEYAAGIARGEEARSLVLRELRKMHESFEAALNARNDVLAAAVARLADLEREMEALASSAREKKREKKKAPRKAA